jgi:hypothetical protein
MEKFVCKCGEVSYGMIPKERCESCGGIPEQVEVKFNRSFLYPDIKDIVKKYSANIPANRAKE